ncbi:MAG: RDD family protein [Pseudomonadota bacterium]
MSTAALESDVPAALWRRLAAIVYDSFLVFAIWIIIGFIVLKAFGITEARTIEGNAVVLEPLYKNTLFAAMLISAYLFFGWFWTHSGQTLGMQAWRIKVQNADRSSISWLQTLLRCGSAPIAFLCAGIGYFWMLFDGKKRTWPDLLSRSVIVKLPV